MFSKGTADGLVVAGIDGTELYFKDAEWLFAGRAPDFVKEGIDEFKLFIALENRRRTGRTHAVFS